MKGIERTHARDLAEAFELGVDAMDGKVADPASVGALIALSAANGNERIIPVPIAADRLADASPLSLRRWATPRCDRRLGS